MVASPVNKTSQRAYEGGVNIGCRHPKVAWDTQTVCQLAIVYVQLHERFGMVRDKSNRHQQDSDLVVSGSLDLLFGT